jgi:hypothetical protein
MDKKLKPKNLYVSTFVIKTANNRVLYTKPLSAEPTHRSSLSGKFVSRDEMKSAFKTASLRLKKA